MSRIAVAAAAAGVGALSAATPASAAPCDARPTSLGAMEVWRLPTGKDLEFNNPGTAGVVRGTYRGDRLTVGLVYRNCAPGAAPLYLSDLRVELEGLGRAFRFGGVADASGLGRPAVHGRRVSWGNRVLTLAPGTQATLLIRVRARRGGQFILGGHYRQASTPAGPFASLGSGLQLSQVFGVSKRRRPGLGVGGGLGGSGHVSCRPYEIIGVRGSGEQYADPLRMSATVGGTARYALQALDRRKVRTESLRYPAAPVTALVTTPNGEGFFDSIAAGEHALVRDLRRLADDCRRSRIGLIGYSQGAAVVSGALRGVAARVRRHVRAVVLYADPYSAGATPYAITLAPPQAPGTSPPRIGHGALGAAAMPIADRVRDICFAGDLICDLTPGLPAQLVQSLTAAIHSTYKSCCPGAPLLRLNGRWLARQLRQ